MNSSKPKIFLKPIILGIFTGIISIFLLLLLFSFFILKSGYNSSPVLDAVSLVILAVSTFFSGYISGRISKNQGLLYGFFCSFILCIFMLVGSIAVGYHSVTMFLIFKAIICTVFGCGGGIIGVNKN